MTVHYDIVKCLKALMDNGNLLEQRLDEERAARAGDLRCVSDYIERLATRVGSLEASVTHLNQSASNQANQDEQPDTQTPGNYYIKVDSLAGDKSKIVTGFDILEKAIDELGARIARTLKDAK